MKVIAGTGWNMKGASELGKGGKTAMKLYSMTSYDDQAKRPNLEIYLVVISKISCFHISSETLWNARLFCVATK